MTRSVVIPESHVGLLYADGVFQRLLEPGKHRLGRTLFDTTQRDVKVVDMRERSLVIKGQEILTADKVAIRVSLLVYFRVSDAPAAMHQVACYEERIYEDVQLAARRFLASRELEAILTDRNDISEAVKAEVRESAFGYGVEIRRADVKDLVFPGNLRDIMNRVLEAQRRAEAQLIEVRQQAETVRIKAEAEAEATRLRAAAEISQAKSSAEAERERLAIRLRGNLEEAQALAANPQLLQLRELETLQAMARSGARFVVGLPQGQSLSKLLDT
jgi:regulator of protease activity HflC (stomatin/prohibitin superfamily)